MKQRILRVFQDRKRVRTTGYMLFIWLYALYMLMARWGQVSAHGLGVLPLIQLGISAVLMLAGSFLLIQREKFAASFLLTSISLGLLYIGSITPYSAPDEMYHYQEVLSMAHGILGRGAVDEALLSTAGFTPEHNTLLALQTMYGGLGESLSGVLVPLPHAPVYLRAYAYLPQLLGTTIGVLCGANRTTIFLLADLFMLLAHAGFGALALRWMPRGWKLPLYLVMLMPMTLQQATSFSYDPVINCLAFLWIGLLAKGWQEGQLIHGRWMFLIGALLIPTKPPYLFLLLLLLFIPAAVFKPSWLKGSARWGRIAYLAGMMASGLLLMAITLWTQPYHVLNQAALEGQVSLGWVLQHPLQGLKLVLSALHPAILIEMLEAGVGVALSSLSLWVGLAAIWCMITILLLSALLPMDSAALPTKYRLGTFLTLCLVYAAFLFVMLITYTKISDPMVMGMQGRYLIPLFPLLLMMLSTPRIKTTHDYTPLLHTAFLLLSLYILDDVWKLTLMG